jgi:hypothetical protein
VPSGSFARAADASLRVKDRLHDDRPISEEDLELLESLSARFAEVNVAFGPFNLVEPPNDDVLPNVKAAAEAINVAVRAVMQAGTSSKLPPSVDLD